MTSLQSIKDPERTLALMQKAWKEAQLKNPNLRQKDIARTLNMNQSAFGQYIRGNLTLNASFVIKFCNALDIPLEDIAPELADHQRPIVLDVKEIKIPIKYALSGTVIPDGQFELCKLLSHSKDRFGIKVDIKETNFPLNSTIICECDSPVSTGDTVALICDHTPIAGVMVKNNGQWLIQYICNNKEAFHAVNKDDPVFRIVGLNIPQVNKLNAYFRK